MSAAGRSVTAMTWANKGMVMRGAPGIKATPLAVARQKAKPASPRCQQKRRRKRETQAIYLLHFWILLGKMWLEGVRHSTVSDERASLMGMVRIQRARRQEPAG